MDLFQPKKYDQNIDKKNLVLLIVSLFSFHFSVFLLLNVHILIIFCIFLIFFFGGTSPSREMMGTQFKTTKIIRIFISSIIIMSFLKFHLSRNRLVQMEGSKKVSSQIQVVASAGCCYCCSMWASLYSCCYYCWLLLLLSIFQCCKECVLILLVLVVP